MNSESYTFGIVKRKIRKLDNGNYVRRNIGICICGQHLLSRSNWATEFDCNKCGNDYFIDATRQSGERFSIPYLELLRKDNRGFKVKRINLSITYNEDSGISVVKKNLTRTMDYDIVDRMLTIWREDVVEYDHTIDARLARKRTAINSYFFKQLDTDTFMNRVSNDVTRGLFNVAKRKSRGDWERKDNLILGFARLMDEPWLQILANAGVPNVERFYESRNYYNNDNYPIDTSKTKPHEILRVPKFMMSYIREDLSINAHVLRQFQGYFKTIDNNKFREIMSIVKDESTMKQLANSIETVMQIHIDYDYTNIKKLVLYLFREVRLTQGIDTPNNASTYLRDYVRMSKALGLEYEKYPKSLKKAHDVVQMNYNIVFNSDDKKREFKIAIEKKSYQNLIYEEKESDFVVIVPTETEDLINEGNELSHCVASYVNDVASDKCKILFLRNKENVDEPLATIEVRGLNIRQAKGYGNRSLNADQKEFVSKWAEEKNLVEAYY